MNIQALINSLLGPLTQYQRLIKLHTPLGPDLLVAERARVLDAIGPHPHLPKDCPQDWADAAGLRLEVDALSPDGHLETKQLMAQSVRLELLTEQGLRSWSVRVHGCRFMGGDGGLARYRLTLEPWLAFLRHRVDAYVFQDQTVPEIVDTVFGDPAHAAFTPAWRWELEDPSVYPKRSLCIQYHESDLDFVQRLLREEGIAYRWEHSEDAHTLVLSDHNDAFPVNAKAAVRYTQSGSVFREDSLTQVHSARRSHVNQLHWASRDHRSTQLRPVSSQAGALLPLELADIPGAYAYPTQADGQRLLDRQLEALQSHAAQVRAAGPWRQAEPGTRVTLLEHPREGGTQFLITASYHQARNNVSADLRAGLLALDAQLAHGERSGELANEREEPLHHVELLWQPFEQTYRPGAGPGHFKRPSVSGLQTAVVVGEGEPTHTDRDHRIKVQFHWQRGSQSSHRLDHPSRADNAPASSASFTWVRVAARVAGANWGAVHVPRLGQEVLVAFQGGDIDRPIVVGSVYNSEGQPNAQGAKTPEGAATATGDAPQWFPGDQAKGKLQSHQHPHVLAGIKTQELATSKTGLGGYNQLVFDDSPGAARLELSTSQVKTRLQLGSLIHQDDNQRLNLRGHGFDLKTDSLGAVRAGAGLLISTHAKPSSFSQARQMDSREPLQQLQSAHELLHTLAHSAQAHQAKGKAEKALPKPFPDEAKDAPRLPNEEAFRGFTQSLQGEQSRSDGQDETNGEGYGGGSGTITAWTRPDLLASSPVAVTRFTPANLISSAGHTHSLIAGQDLQRLAQGHSALTVKGDLTLYTYGRAENPKKPTQQKGIAMHAAQGSVHVGALKAKVMVHADKELQVNSTNATVKIVAPKKVLFAAGGSAIEIQPGNITLYSAGTVHFQASLDDLTGVAGGGAAVSLKRPGSLKPLHVERFQAIDQITGQPIARLAYRIEIADGTEVRGLTDERGLTQSVRTADPQGLKLYWEPMDTASHLPDLMTDEIC